MMPTYRNSRDARLRGWLSTVDRAGVAVGNRARRNPLQQPTPDMGLSVVSPEPGIVEFYLYDVTDLDRSPEEAMIGAAMVVAKPGGTKKKPAPRWEATGMAAVRGFGPLLYDIAATGLKARLHATEDQSDAAKAFWTRQGQRYVDPLTPEAFEAKYGTTWQNLYAQGVDLTPDEALRMRDELIDIFYAARAAEAAGTPRRLRREQR
jgi:hypothetical protein